MKEENKKVVNINENGATNETEAKGLTGLVNKWRVWKSTEKGAKTIIVVKAVGHVFLIVTANVLSYGLGNYVGKRLAYSAINKANDEDNEKHSGRYPWGGDDIDTPEITVSDVTTTDEINAFIDAKLNGGGDEVVNTSNDTET